MGKLLKIDNPQLTNCNLLENAGFITWCFLRSNDSFSFHFYEHFPLEDIRYQNDQLEFVTFGIPTVF